MIIGWWWWWWRRKSHRFNGDYDSGDDKKNNVHDISEDFYDDRNLVDDDDYVDDTNHAKVACEQALHLGKSREVTRE